MLSNENPVLLIHGSLSSSRMWQPYLDGVLSQRRVLTPDLVGYGANPPWEPLAPFTVRDELEPLLAALQGPVDIAAHSYGAAIALCLLVEAPHLVRSLVLIEPAAFFLLRDLGPEAAGDRQEIGEVAAFIRFALQAGARAAAATRFVDYWNGSGTFAAMPDTRRSALCARMGKVAADFDAISGVREGLDALRYIETPTLIVTGDRGPGGPRRIGEAIARTTARASVHCIPGAGHMLPLSHGAALADVLAGWSGQCLSHSRSRAA